MLTRSQAVKALRARLRERPDDQAMWSTIRDFDLGRYTNEVEDAAVALVTSAILEQGLETALLTHFPDITEEDRKNIFENDQAGPLSDFGAKIWVGYALGIFGPTSRQDIADIRHIRNAFAHVRSHLSFDSPEIAALCDHLSYIDKMTWDGVMGPKPDTPRRKFIETIMNYYAYFTTESQKGAPVRWQQADEVMRDLYS